MADQYIVTALIIAIVIMAAALIAIVMLIKELQKDIEELEETAHEFSEYRKEQSFIGIDNVQAIRDLNDRVNMLEKLHLMDLTRLKANLKNAEAMKADLFDPNIIEGVKND
ncbi:MAG: hypothetical protein LKF53_02090 [Solobacterium sp.]|jgi:uncharacterized membrane protein (DUF106 family)|nr:hypothetical protein [Solobacterium sp.]MCH4226761.1 hypothetical protein [Solobacterium sp.]MCH4281910.1 hypothetical protein [Solobacterium sp.]